MEAANLGAYFAQFSDDDLKSALRLLAQFPHYSDQGYHEAALQVLEKWPSAATSLAIPTWFYGHEPTNVFASHIAKYFSNSIREDTLLAICLSGVIFAPGSAGTLQEIFMDLAQNYYRTYGWRSPMIFFQKTVFEEMKVLEVLQRFLQQHPFQDYVLATDSAEGVLSFIKAHPPISS